MMSLSSSLERSFQGMLVRIFNFGANLRRSVRDSPKTSPWKGLIAPWAMERFLLGMTRL